jgi:Transposase DNA-binding
MDGTSGTWFDREIEGCRLADRRLHKRLGNLLERMGEAMGASIPLACQDWANTKAAYRFFSNDRINEAEILAGHFEATRDRFAATDGPILVLHTLEFLPGPEFNGGEAQR